MPEIRLNAPIFLMCSERSGSNLIAKVFDAHPEIVSPGAAHLFRVFSPLQNRQEDNLHALRSDLLDLLEAKFGRWLIDADGRQVLMKIIDDAASPLDMIATLYEAERRKSGKTRIFIKECSIYGFLDWMERAAIDPSYVYMVRDPRDMALSWRNASAFRGGVMRAAKHWVTEQSGFLAVIDALGQTRKLATLTYEELLSAPDRVLQRVCSSLHIDFHPDMVDFSRHSQSAAYEATRAKMLGNLAKPIMRDNFGKFSQGLDAAELSYVEAVCGPLMTKFGYLPTRSECNDPFAGFHSFEELEEHIASREPWEKQQFRELNEDERQRYDNWVAVRARVQSRQGAA